MSGASRSRRVVRLPAMTVGILLAALVVPSSRVAARAAETDSLEHKQEAQTRARELASRLVAGVLDVQLRQLRENGMRELPIHDDITRMRANIDQLVREEMKDVVQLLTEAQQGDPARRLDNLRQARDSIREIVVRLMAERQRLYRRLQVARLAAHVRQLIDLESRAMLATKSLSEMAGVQREPMMLRTIEDQRDVHALHDQLVGLLNDVGGWGGEIGAGAAAGIRVLRAGQTDQELDAADANLAVGKAEQAARHQQKVVQVLRALLERIDESRGLGGADHEAALRAVREMIRRQHLLREETEDIDVADEGQTEPLVRRQQELHKSLAGLSDTLRRYPVADPLTEQASAAAYRAVSDLFRQRKDEAILAQGRVIGALSELEQRLGQMIDDRRGEHSAEELAERSGRLERLGEALREITERQAEVADNFDRRDVARTAQDDVVARLAALPADERLPGAIASRLADARDKVALARDALRGDTPRNPPREQGGVLNPGGDTPGNPPREQGDTPRNPPREQGSPANQVGDPPRPRVEEADEALRLALSETESQLADTRRRQAAVEVGELMRASEALERAAAAQRRIGDEARDAAAEGISRDRAETLGQVQQEIAGVAEKIGEGVRYRDPRVSDDLSALHRPIDDIAGELRRIAEDETNDATATTERIAERSATAAEMMEQAAETLRSRAEETATRLVEISGDQLSAVESISEPVARTLEEAAHGARRDEGDDEVLRQALNVVKSAGIEQLRAAGKEQAARAGELAARIADVLETQQDAERIVDAIARGRPESPIEAAGRQQQVAQEAARLASEGRGTARGFLENAAQAAAEAAKETLTGDPNKASAARARAGRALIEAQDVARQLADDRADSPPDQPADAQAQRKVGELVRQADQLATRSVPAAAESLRRAEDRSSQAERLLGRSDDPTGEPLKRLQQSVRQSLEEAESRLQEARQELLARRGEQLGAQAESAERLAAEAASIDTAAAAALRQTARQRVSADDARVLDEAQAEAQRSLERAAASLSARRQTIEQDRDIAAALVELAQRQQSSRAEIARQAQRLQQEEESEQDEEEQPEESEPQGRAPRSDVPPQPSDPNAETETLEPTEREDRRREAARALEAATREFAQSMRAAGEGAAAVSGQQQVANQPIREGLRAASGLPREPRPIPQTATARTDPGGQDPADPNAPGPDERHPVTGPGSRQAGTSQTTSDPTGAGQPGGESTAPAGAGQVGMDPIGASPTGAAPTGAGQSGLPVAGRSGEARSGDLGTALVPSSPEVTADQVAGARALALAASALAGGESRESETPDAGKGQGQSQESAPGEGQGDGQGSGDEGQPGQADAGEEQGAGRGRQGRGAGSPSDGGSSSSSGDPSSSDAAARSDSGGQGDGGARPGEDRRGPEAGRRSFEQEPWFTRLPPEVREAIQARARRRPPRGYEERLRRYFESID